LLLTIRRVYHWEDWNWNLGIVHDWRIEQKTE
jgi:hypothetical protein